MADKFIKKEHTNNVTFINNNVTQKVMQPCNDVKIDIVKPNVKGSGNENRVANPLVNKDRPLSPRSTQKLTTQYVPPSSPKNHIINRLSLKKPTPPVYVYPAPTDNAMGGQQIMGKHVTSSAVNNLQSIMIKGKTKANINSKTFSDRRPSKDNTFRVNHQQKLIPNPEYARRQKSKFKNEDGSHDSFSAFAEEFVDVRKMETGLLNLLSDFHKGHLQAFGRDDAFLKMDEVRMLQEKISKKHFEIDMMHLSRGFESKEDRQRNNVNMSDMMVDLEKLSTKIQYIHNEMIDNPMKDKDSSDNIDPSKDGKTIPIVDIQDSGQLARSGKPGKHRISGKKRMSQSKSPSKSSNITSANTQTPNVVIKPKTAPLKPPIINISSDTKDSSMLSKLDKNSVLQTAKGISKKKSEKYSDAL